MSNILSFRIPLRENITLRDIRDLVADWLRTSRYYNFDDLQRIYKEQTGVLTSVRDINKSTLYFCNEPDTESGVTYSAYRVDTEDTFNLLWRTDIIYIEETPQEKQLVIRHGRSAIVSALPADFSEKVKYPLILQLLEERGMPQPDSWLKLHRPMRVSDLSAQERDMLQRLYTFSECMNFPIMFVYADREFLENRGNPDKSVTAAEPDDGKWNYERDGYRGLIDFFSCTCHTFIAENDADNVLWNSLSKRDRSPFQSRSDKRPACHRIEISVPGAGLMNYIPLTETLDPDQLYHFLIMMLQTSQQTFPENLPDYDFIYNLYEKKQHQTSVSPYYISMNQEIADRIRNARKAADMTQDELAEKLNVTKMLISRLERMQTIKVKRSLINEMEKTLMLKEDSLTSLQNTQ